MALRRIFGALRISSIALLGVVAAHGGSGGHQKPIQVAEDADWATKHMAGEHHISSFDTSSFFTLHDYDSNGFWDRNEILKTYGMEDPSAKDVTQEKKDEIVAEIFKLLDVNGDQIVERDEFEMYYAHGKVLPDFGLGPGHHWDMEMEYEIHHWEKYHDENTKEEDLIHPEDIEHFRLHDQLEDEAAKQAAEDRIAIVEHNIPPKFRRDAPV